MTFLVYALPLILVAISIARQARHIWKDGLFLALVRLGITLVSAFLAFFLTRLLLDPAKVDLFGLGALLLQWVPEAFITVMPRLEAFLRALPTALLALVGFTVIFDILRVQGGKLLHKLNEKYRWSERFLKIKYEKLVTTLVGILIAAVCLVPELMIVTGTLTFSGNMLYCAKTATGQAVFTTMGDFVHQLQESPLIILCQKLGAEDMFFALTSAQRDGEPFSVGEEMNHLSDTFVGILPVYEVLDRTDEAPSPEQIRALPEVLTSTEESLELTVGLARSYSGELGDSDAVLIISTLMGTTPERFEEYLSQLTPETAERDLPTICELAAMLGDRGLIPEEGELFDMNALQDPELLADIAQEVQKNPGLAAFFAPG